MNNLGIKKFNFRSQQGQKLCVIFFCLKKLSVLVNDAKVLVVVEYGIGRLIE
jgi:hypothetical protein